MPDTTPMRRLSEEKIWATLESMRRDLDKAYESLPEKGKLSKYDLDYMVRIRVISEEIIRWLVL